MDVFLLLASFCFPDGGLLPLWFSSLPFLMSSSVSRSPPHLWNSISIYWRSYATTHPFFSFNSQVISYFVGLNLAGIYKSKFHLIAYQLASLSFGSVLFSRTDPGLVVLCWALFWSLWMFWDRRSEAVTWWFPNEPRGSLSGFLRITFKAANTEWWRWLWRSKLIFFLERDYLWKLFWL